MTPAAMGGGQMSQFSLQMSMAVRFHHPPGLMQGFRPRLLPSSPEHIAYVDPAGRHIHYPQGNSDPQA